MGGWFGGELFAGGDFFPGRASSRVLIGQSGVCQGEWRAAVMAWLCIRLFFLTDS